ncbi:hypothetical protein ABW19_dt0201731 [Dactylella cylindrospora]|nr:hypothetical protein ABW19_dt0201731 [Dactylella cylindrospora]
MAHGDYFEKVTDILEVIGRECPLVEEFQRLLPDPYLQDAVCEFYSVIVTFCQSVLQVITATGGKSHVKAIWKSLKGEFPQIETKIKQNQAHVKTCIELAAQKAQHRERQLDAHFRNHIIDYTAREIERWDKALKWRLTQDHRQKR